MMKIFLKNGCKIFLLAIYTQYITCDLHVFTKNQNIIELETIESTSFSTEFN